MKYYKRDPDAFKGGTLGLTLEEIGAYTLLLDDIYARDGYVPDDIGYLCRLWRCDPRVARRLRETLIIEEKASTTGVLMTNLRAMYELSTADVTRYLNAKRKRKQRNGGQSHAENLESRINKEEKKNPKGFSSTLPVERKDTKARAAPLKAARALSPPSPPDDEPLEPNQVTWEQAERLRNGRWVNGRG